MGKIIPNMHFSVLILQITLIIVSFKISTLLKKVFNRADVIAILFCSTHKSLTLGKDILNVYTE